MPIEVAELNEWVKTDEGKGWLNGQTSELRQKLGTAEGKVSELTTQNQTLQTSHSTLTSENEKLSGDLEKALEGLADPNEELQNKVTSLTQNLTTAQQQTATLQKQILNEKISSLIGEEITRQGGNPAVLGIHVRRQLAAELTEDGQLVVHAIDNDGKTVYGSSAKPEGVEYVVSQLKQNSAFKSSFMAPAKSGSGQLDSQDPNPSNVNSKSFLDMNLDELGDQNNLKNALFTN